MKSKIKYSSAARIVFTILLLVLIYSKIDFLDLVDRLSSVSVFDFIVCCLLYLVGQILSAYKWRQLLTEVKVFPSNFEIVRAYLLGMFINSFGLGTVGGDVARVFSLKCETGKRTGVFASVVADRLHGLTVLLTIGVFSLIIIRPPYMSDLTLYAAVGSAIVFILGWFLGPFALMKVLPSWTPKREKIMESLKVFPKSKEILIKITIVSFIFHMVQIYLAYYIFNLVTANVNFSTIMTSIPFVNVASALPLSINGIGVREAISMYLLAPAGITSETSVAFSALWVFVITIVSGIGGLVVIPGMGEGIGAFMNRLNTKE